MTKRSRPVSLAAITILLAAPLSAQWTHTGAGPALVNTTACFDTARGVVVAFGGHPGAAPGPFGGGFEYDGTGWTNITATGPANRYEATLAYMDHLGVSVLFGGWTGTNSLVGDTWHWNGATWTQNAAPGPSPRFGHAMVYDSDRGVVVFYGGMFASGNPGQVYDDTWEYDGFTWTQRNVVGPGFRNRHAMAYDSHRKRTVLYGGEFLSTETWEWDGIAWSLEGNGGPGFRAEHAMSYDPIRKRVFLFGGSILGGIANQDQFEWDGATWTSLGAGAPPAREGHAMAYDSSRHTTVLFGGSVSFLPPPADTWERAAAGSFEPFGSGCFGTPPVPVACAQNNPGGGTLVGTTSPVEFGCATTSPGVPIAGFDIYTQSTGGFVTVPAHIYQYPSTTPLASTTITIGPSAGFYSAVLPAPLNASGPLLLAVDVSAQNVVIPNLTSGSAGSVFTRQGGGSWTYLAGQRTGWILRCPSTASPSLDHVGDPAIGASYQVTLDIAPASIAVLLSGNTDQNYLGQSLPWTLPGTANCDLLVSADLAHPPVSTASGGATTTIQVPPGMHLVGAELFHQWAILDPANSLGITTSNAAAVVVGH